jgi:hypothetical protein
MATTGTGNLNVLSSTWHILQSLGWQVLSVGNAIHRPYHCASHKVLHKLYGSSVSSRFSNMDRGVYLFEVFDRFYSSDEAQEMR